MSNIIYLQSYKLASEGARSIQSSINQTNPDFTTYRKTKNDLAENFTNNRILINKYLLINWGCSERFSAFKFKKNTLFLNINNVLTHTNKLEFFQYYANIPSILPYLPLFSTDRSDAIRWSAMTNPGGIAFVERHVLNGHSGEGINLVRGGCLTGEAPLYVRYIKKAQEFRVHFFRDLNLYHYQQKKLLVDTPRHEDTFKVRNRSNGWVYCTENIDIPDQVKLAAVDFARVTPLNFGALDIIYNKNSNRAYILEVNSAPGLTGKTLQFYKDCFLKIFNTHNWGATNNAYTPLGVVS